MRRGDVPGVCTCPFMRAKFPKWREPTSYSQPMHIAFVVTAESRRHCMHMRLTLARLFFNFLADGRPRGYTFGGRGLYEAGHFSTRTDSLSVPAGSEGVFFGEAAMDAEHTDTMRPQLELEMGPPPSDDVLMRAFQDGGEHGFVALVERYGKKALNYAWRLTGDFALAQDVAQEAFLAVYTRRDTFQPGGNFAGWLYRIVGNLCRMEWRRRRRKRAPLDGGRVAAGDPADLAAGHVADKGPSPAESAARRELERHVRRAVVELPVKLRTVFVLSFYEGLSYKAIAGVLGCSVGTVGSRKHLAMRRLQNSLSAVGAELLSTEA